MGQCSSLVLLCAWVPWQGHSVKHHDDLPGGREAAGLYLWGLRYLWGVGYHGVLLDLPPSCRGLHPTAVVLPCWLLTLVLPYLPQVQGQTTPSRSEVLGQGAGSCSPFTWLCRLSTSGRSCGFPPGPCHSQDLSQAAGDVGDPRDMCPGCVPACGWTGRGLRTGAPRTLDRGLCLVG
jgi:hypothetical protein